MCMTCDRLLTVQDELSEILEDNLKSYQHMNIYELGKIADIVKDLSEAKYHCTIVEEMEKGSVSATKVAQNVVNPTIH